MKQGRPGSPHMVACGVVFLGLALSGCAGFVGGGVATASAENGRVAVTSRAAGAALGPSGSAAGTSHSAMTVCVTPDGSSQSC